ncbi:MAG TPA: tetratricopeptide repeat protein [Candidatus Sumerlaeota bacterium]|nr:tetratricopeptide repeat protein [Candidatus Sumerlaeota bacterium]
MSTLSPSDIIEQINDKVDPRDLLEKIDYATDKIQIIGPTLKCFCPIHKEKAFRSLIVDLKKKTYRCSLKTCKGFDGGNLVQFHAVYTDQSELKAAFSLAKLLSLEIDPSLITGLSQTFLAEARQAFLERDMDLAQSLINQSLDVAPENHEARYLFGQILEELGDSLGSIREFRTAADGFSSAADMTRAVEIYEQYLLKREPRNEDILKSAADLYEKTGNTLRAVEIYLRIAAENETRGDSGKNIEYYSRVLELDPSRDDVHLLLAQLYEKTENLPGAVLEYLKVADLAGEKSEWPKALEYLNHIKQIVPENFQSREKIAEIYSLLEDFPKAESEYLELGETAIELEDLDTAKRAFNTIIAKLPDSIAAHEGLINLFEKTGDNAAVTRECLTLSVVFEKSADYERAAAALRRALQVSPADASILRKLIDILIKAARKDDAIRALFELADLFHKAEDKSRRDSCFSEIRSIEPDNHHLHMRIALCHHQYGEVAPAREEIIDLADHLQDGEKYESCLEICDEALKLDSGHIPFHERKLAALISLDRKDEAIEVYKTLFTLHKNAGDLESAEEALRDALSLDEKNIFLHKQIIEICLSRKDKSNALSSLLSLNQIYFEQNDIDGGIESARKILELSPESVATRERIASLYREQQSYALAIEEYFNASHQYTTLNQYSAAINDLRKILEMDGENRVALLEISELILKSDSFDSSLPYLMKGLECLKSTGSQDEVIAEYRRILGLKDEQLDLHEEFAEYLKTIGRNEDAASEIHTLAGIHRSKKDFPKAAGLLEDLISLRPGDEAIKSELADMYVALDIPQEALNYYAQAAAGYLESGNEKKTIEIYRKIIAIEPAEESIREELARLLSAHGEIAEAVGHLCFLADLRSGQGREQENLAVYLDLLQLEPDRHDMREKLAQLYETAGEPENAAQELLILADYSIRESDLDTAIVRCRKAADLNPDSDAPRLRLLDLYEKNNDLESLKSQLLELGDLYLRLSNIDQAETQFKKARELDPADILVSEQLVRIFEHRGDLDAAVVEYRNIAVLYEQSERYDDLINVLRRIKSIEAKDVAIRERIADLLVRTSRLQEAIEEYYELAVLVFEQKTKKKAPQYLDSMARIAPGDINARMKSARLLIEKNQVKDALRHILELGDILLQEGRYDEIVQCADEGLTADETNVSLLDLKIQALLGKEDIPSAIEVYRLAGQYAYMGDDYGRAQSCYDAILSWKADDVDALEQSIECALQLDKKDRAVELLLSLSDIHESAPALDRAIATTRRVLEISESRLDVRCRLAELLLKNNDLPAAISEFERISDQYAAGGDYPSASTFLSRILELNPQSVDTTRKLAHLVHKNETMEKARPHFYRLLELCRNQYEPMEAVAEYESILKLDPDYADLHLDFARFLRSLVMMDKSRLQFRQAAAILQKDIKTKTGAIKILKELLELNENDTQVLYDIATLCVQTENPTEARGFFERCAEVFLASGQVDEAIEQLLSALDISPEDSSLLTRIADLYEQTGQIESAIHRYKDLSALNVRANALSKNVDVYRKILALDEHLKPVRRSLAELYENLKDISQATIQYLALASQHQADGEVEDALKIYSHVKTINPAEKDNRKNLAKIFLAQGAKNKARTELEELADLFSGEKNLDEAQVYLGQVRDLAPRDLAIGEKMARLHEMRGDLDAASAEYLRVARIHREDKHFDQARNLLNQILSFAPDNIAVHEELLTLLQEAGLKAEFISHGLDLTGLYFSMGQFEESLRVCKCISEHDPSDIDSRLKVARILFDNSMKDEAAEEYHLLTSYLVKASRYQEAAGVSDNALGLFPENAAILGDRIQAAIGLKDTRSAAGLYLRLAGIHRQRKNQEAEEDALRKAVDFSPAMLEAHESLVELFINMDRVKDAVDELLVISGIFKGQNNEKGAISCHQRIIEIDPENKNVRDGLASLYKAAGDIKAAVGEFFTLAKLYEKDQDFDSAMLYYGEILAAEDRNVEALRALIRITKLKKDTKAFISYTEQLARYFESMQAWADALPLYQSIIEANPAHLPAYQRLAACFEGTDDVDEAINTYKALADQYARQGAFKAAIAQLQTVEQRRPDDSDNLFKLAELHIKADSPDEALVYYGRAAELLQGLGDLDKAITIVQTMIRIRPDNPASHKINAELLESLGRGDEAASTYSHLAALYDKKAEAEAAVEARSRALMLKPEMIEDREKYARGLQKIGRNTEAITQFLQIADKYITRKSHEKATQWASQVISLDSENAEAHKKLKAIFVITGRSEEAVREIEWLAAHFTETNSLQDAEILLLEGIELDPKNITLHENLVDIYIQMGRIENATDQLLKITQQALFLGNLPMAVSALERARDLSGDNVEIRKTLAGLYNRGGESDKAREELFYTANLLLEQGLVEKSEQICSGMIDLAPKDCILRERVAELFLKHDIPELAARQFIEISSLKKTEQKYEEVIIFADKTLAINNRSTEARENRIESFLKLDRRKDAYDELKILSDIYTDLGYLDKARDAYTLMVDLMPDDPLPRQKLVTLYTLTNNHEEQISALRGLAELFVKLDRTEEAVESYKAILDVKPDDTRARMRYIDLYARIGPEMELVDDYLKLIEIFCKHGARAEATRIYEKLAQISPYDPEIKEKFIKYLVSNGEDHRAFEEMLSLSTIYVENGQFRKATSVLGQAVKIAPDDPSVHVKLAEAYVLMNARGMAVQEYMKAAELFEQSGNEESTLQIFAKTILIDPQNLDARRSYIARLVNASKTEEALNQQKKLADLYIDRGLLDLAENVYRDIIDMDPENIEIWNFLIQTHLQIGLEEDLLDDYQTLGDIYLARGAVKDALQQYKKIVEIDPINVDARRRYIDAYLQIGLENDLVDDYLQLADALVEKGDVDEAVAIYSHVTSLDPENPLAMQKLSQTRALHAKTSASGTKSSNGKKKTPHPPAAPAPAAPAATAAKPESPREPSATQTSSYQDTIDNYKNILSVNPSNANIRCKLAEIYMQMGKNEEAMNEWDKASETFIFKGELDKGITLCEKILEHRPSDAAVRERLSRAILQKDSFKAIESAISAFTDTFDKPSDDSADEKGRPDAFEKKKKKK